MSGSKGLIGNTKEENFRNTRTMSFETKEDKKSLLTGDGRFQGRLDKHDTLGQGHGEVT